MASKGRQRQEAKNRLAGGLCGNLENWQKLNQNHVKLNQNHAEKQTKRSTLVDQSSF
jgi:hypothetical protein